MNFNGPVVKFKYNDKQTTIFGHTRFITLEKPVDWEISIPKT